MLKDPYVILELPRETTNDEVRKAYLRAIRLCPPEKDAEAFQRIQTAYNIIKTEQHRRERELFNYQSPTLEDIIAQAASRPSTETQRPTLTTIQALLHHGIKYKI